MERHTFYWLDQITAADLHRNVQPSFFQGFFKHRQKSIKMFQIKGTLIKLTLIWSPIIRMVWMTS